MPQTEEIISFCQQFLRIDEVDDPWCVNGLQVPGKKIAKRIALGVTASANFLQQAAEWKADMVVVHHGLFWKNGVRQLDHILANRLKVLFNNDISLVAYHLPLDGHAGIGNNSLIAKKLGLQNIKMHDICAVGEYSADVAFAGFLASCTAMFKRQPFFSENFTGAAVRRVGVCSGGGGDFATICKKAGADTFVTGEISEHHFHSLRESQLNFVACGHYATEKFGIIALGEQIKEAFSDVETFFFEEPCPV